MEIPPYFLCYLLFCFLLLYLSSTVINTNTCPHYAFSPLAKHKSSLTSSIASQEPTTITAYFDQSHTSLLPTKHKAREKLLDILDPAQSSNPRNMLIRTHNHHTALPSNTHSLVCPPVALMVRNIIYEHPLIINLPFFFLFLFALHIPITSLREIRKLDRNPRRAMDRQKLDHG